MFFLSVISLLAITVQTEGNTELQFPVDFKLGVSTSSYQIEGAWNVSDKGVSLWDEYTHRKLSPIEDGSDGDIAADSYHKYKEDVALLKKLGVDFYRFSLSWSRILPTGFANQVSKDGIEYYKNLLDELHAQGIEPLVTIYHLDHPWVLEEMGGWTNEMMVTWFADYARVVFRELGDRIKIFTTINEPAVTCNVAYGVGSIAPGKKIKGIAPYLCMHNMLKAHAKAYRIYDTEFRNIHDGKVGIVIPWTPFYPKYSNDTESADIQHAFSWGWTANPIFSKTGDYPAVMKRRIAENSAFEGYPRSRLPEFTKTEIDEIRGSADFFGLNHYTSMLVEPAPKSNKTIWPEDTGLIRSYDASWESTFVPWLKIFPQGLGDVLRKVKDLYNNPPVYVLENGLGDDGRLDDFQRIRYLHDYLKELLIAVNRDNCNVKGYAVWSLIDNFQWNAGYMLKFGLTFSSGEFRKEQGGQIGIVIPCASYYAKYPNDTETPAVQTAFAWGWAANPIYSKEGDYPLVMKQRIAENSRLEGYPRSRLPEFTQAEIEEIRGSADYFGLNHYLSKLTEAAPKSDTTPWFEDSGVLLSFDPSWPHYKASSWLRVVPKGFRDIVRQIKTMYDNPPIYIMENGIADDGSSLDDHVRIGYLHDYLRELLKAVNEDNCNVKMYGVWSFLDNFEWEQGQTDHFGIVSVDFQNPSRTRTPKLSYRWYQELLRSRTLPPIDFARTLK